MAKRKHPEWHIVDQYVGKEEDNVVLRSEETSVPVGEAPKEGVIVDWPTGVEGSTRGTDKPACVATAKPVEEGTLELGAFWSLLADAGYTIW